jgi:tetratricopeptide (TPR) repeat protein
LNFRIANQHSLGYITHYEVPMGSSPVVTSKNLAALLRRRRESLHLTLRQVAVRAEERGERLPPSTLSRIESGKLDPGVRRLNVLIRLYDLQPDYVADLVEIESLAVQRPTGDLETLQQEGERYWERGDVPQALGHALAIMEHAPQDEASRLRRQKAVLNFASYARGLSKYGLAQRLIDGLLCEPPDESLMVDALLVSSSIWAHRGARAVALGLGREAVRRLKPGRHNDAAKAHHQLARTLLEGGWVEEAAAELDVAFSHYAKAEGSAHNEALARILRARVLEKLGRLDEALAYARETLQVADKEDRGRTKLNARLEVGRLLLASGGHDEAIDELRRALAEATLLQDRVAEFHAHTRLWKAFERVNDARSARMELDRARALLPFVGNDNNPDLQMVRATLDARPRKA